MSMTAASRWNIHRFGDGGMIKGVCATIAERAGVPVWMPRMAFLIFAVLHWFLAAVLYVVLARLWRPVHARVAARCAPAWPEAEYGGVRDRFTALDARLAELEATTLQQEASLRREFRDLERR